MNQRTLREATQPARLEQERASDLLERYPDVTGEEAGAILNFLQTGDYFDVGLLTSNARLKPKLDAFLKDHRDHFDAEPGRAEAVIGLAVLFLFVAWAVWAVLN